MKLYKAIKQEWAYIRLLWEWGHRADAIASVLIYGICLYMLVCLSFLVIGELM